MTGWWHDQVTLVAWQGLEASRSDAAAVQAGGAAGSASAEQPVPATASEPAPVEPPALHGLDRDVVWMRRKFGGDMVQLLPAVSTASAADGLLRFVLTVLPTDPAWPPEQGRLRLEVCVSSSYPEAGSLTLVARAAEGCTVSNEVFHTLNRLWNAEASQLAAPDGVPARGASPLKLLLLSIENHAGATAERVQQLQASRVPALAAGAVPTDSPCAATSDAQQAADLSSGAPWRKGLGAGLWWPCSHGQDAAALRAEALSCLPDLSSSETDLSPPSSSISSAAGSGRVSGTDADTAHTSNSAQPGHAGQQGDGVNTSAAGVADSSEMRGDRQRSIRYIQHGLNRSSCHAAGLLELLNCPMRPSARVIVASGF